MGTRASRTRPHPPAWYPDPRDPLQLRRWNGRHWTRDVRPFPEWLRTLELAPGPPGLEPGRLARRLWAMSTVAMTAALLLLLSITAPSRSNAPDERVRDQTFVAEARRACEAADRTVVKPYLAQPAEERDADELARGLDTLVDDLRAIDVDSTDELRVQRWLDAWSEFTRAGHAYAAALEDGDERGAAAITAQSQQARVAIDRFAYANGLTDCALTRS